MLSLRLWIFLSLLCAAAQAFAQPRIAIVSGPEVRDESALLTAQLTSSGITLVERDQVEKIAAEKALATNDAAAIGKLLNADAVIFLSRKKMGGRDVLVFSLSATRVGVRIASSFDGLPLPNIEEWSARLAQNVQALLPNLSVTRKEAIPLSVLNIRAALATEEALGVENTVNYLLIQRLVRQRGFFVLEREKLDLLRQEKLLAAEDEPFWAGSRILDGQLSTANGKLTLSIKVEAPNEDAGFEVIGGGDSPLELVDDTVTQLTNRLGAVGASGDWDLQSEAKRFFQEAASADAAGLWQLALAAAETAAALGLDSEPLDLLRIRLNARKALPSDYVKIQGWRYEPGKVKPEAFSAEHALTAVELAAKRALSISKSTRGWREDSIEELAEAAIQAASRTLRCLHDAEQEKTPLYQTLRAKTRAAVDIVLDRAAPNRQIGIHHLTVVYAPYWEEDQDAALTRYRKSLNATLGESTHQVFWLRYLFTYNRDGTGDALDPSKVPWLLDVVKWNEFVRSLRDSPQLQDRLDACLIDYCSAPKADRTKIAEQISQRLLELRSDLFRERITTGQVMAILEVFGNLESERAKQFEHLRIQMLLSYFDALAPFTGAMISICTESAHLEKENAAKLLAAAAVYRERTDQARKWQALSDVDELRRFEIGLLEKFPDLAPPTVAGTKVERYWRPTPGTHASPKMVQQVHFREGALWVLISGPRPKRHLELVEFDLATWTVRSSLEYSGLLSKTRWPWEELDFDITAKWIVLAEPGFVHRLDRQNGEWKTVEVPRERPVVRVLQDQIYYAFPGLVHNRTDTTESCGVLMIDAHTLAVETIASSRSKAGKSILDNTKPYRILQLAPGPDGQLLATVRLDYRTWTIDQTLAKVLLFAPASRTWQDPFPDLFHRWNGAFTVSGHGGVILQPHDHAHRESIFLWEFGQAPRPILVQRPGPSRQTFTRSEFEGIVKLAAGAPTVGSVEPGEFWLLTTDVKQTSPYLLHHFQDEVSRAIPLELPTIEEIGLETFHRPTLLVTPHGLVFHGNDRRGFQNAAFWFLPFDKVPR